MFQLQTYWSDWPDTKESLLRAWKAYKSKPELCVAEDSLSPPQRALREVERRIETDPELKALGVEFLPQGGRAFVKEVEGIKTFWCAPGGHIQASTMHVDVFEMPRDEVGFHVYEFEDRLKVESSRWDDFVNAAVFKTKLEIMERIFALLGAAVPLESPFYMGARIDEYGRGHESMSASDAMYEVLDETPQFGKDVLAIGRWPLLGRLGALREDLLRIIDLRKVVDDGREVFPEDTAYVASPSACKFVIWQQPAWKEYTDDAWYQHLIMRWGFGGMIHHPERIRRLSTTLRPAPQVMESALDVPDGGVGGDPDSVTE